METKRSFRMILAKALALLIVFVAKADARQDCGPRMEPSPTGTSRAAKGQNLFWCISN